MQRCTPAQTVEKLRRKVQVSIDLGSLFQNGQSLFKLTFLDKGGNACNESRRVILLYRWIVELLCCFFAFSRVATASSVFPVLNCSKAVEREFLFETSTASCLLGSLLLLTGKFPLLISKFAREPGLLRFLLLQPLCGVRSFGLFGGYSTGNILGDSVVFTASEEDIRQQFSKGSFPVEISELGPPLALNV